jgi:hypothetical protein
MAGIIIDPIAATVAGLEPEIAAKNIQVTIATSAKPPVIEPTILFARLINRRDIPPPSIKEPAIIKKGIAIKGKDDTAVNIRWATTKRGISLITASVITEAKPNTTAIGNPQADSTAKLPKRIPPMG